VDDGSLIVQCPRRILLAGGRVDPGLSQELREGVSQTSVVKHDAYRMGETDVGLPDLLCLCVQALAVIGAHIDLFLQVPSVLHLHQLDDADHGVVSLAVDGRRQVYSHHIGGRALGRLRQLHLLQRPAALSQIVGEHAAALRTDEEAAILHGELRLRHLLLFLQEELHQGSN